jgi:hypothetical protein
VHHFGYDLHDIILGSSIGTLLDLTRSRTDLVLENVLLRQQPIILKRQLKRPVLATSSIIVFWEKLYH